MKYRDGLTHLLVCVTGFWIVAMTGCGGGEGSGGGAPAAGAPTAMTAPVLAATARDGFVELSWAAVSGATGYNFYWSNTSGVTPANGTKIAIQTGAQTGTLSGIDAGLVNGRTYYYVMTATTATTESGVSAQASASPANGVAANDPIYMAQWHLNNTGQANVDGSPGGTPGEDVNVEPAWAACGTGSTCRGEGVRVAVVDSGPEMAHEDLKANFATEMSHNYVNGSTDPTSADATNFHGTSVAGIIAARDGNGLGVRGVAPRANLVGYNLLDASETANAADAMTRNVAKIAVSNNSWGPPDDGTWQAADPDWIAAINTGLTIGRGGRGTVYLFAAGNGGCPLGASPSTCDNSNYDGQTNYRGVMAVAAVTNKGSKSPYSERGANLWVSAPGGEYCDTHAVTSTDRTGDAGVNSATDANIDYIDSNYTQCMNGTSAATPVASGVVALMLQANANLGWRDVRWIFAETARVNDPTNAEWVLNGATPRVWVNQNYGFGVVDAAAAVAAAKTWTNLPAEKIPFSPPAKVGLSRLIPDNDTAGITDTITVTGSGIRKIEYIEITITVANNTASENVAGDLEISLINTSNSNGVTSVLTEAHTCTDNSTNPPTAGVVCRIPYTAAVFGSARHLGEPADGVWRLAVKDLSAQDTGTLKSWGLKFFGH